MAINTKARRASVQATILGFMQPPPSGTIDLAARATVTWLYSGLAFATGPAGIIAGFFTIPNCVKDLEFRNFMRTEAEGGGVWTSWVAGVDLPTLPVPRGSANLILNIALIQNEAEGTPLWARWAPGVQRENTGNLQLNMVSAINANFGLS